MALRMDFKSKAGKVGSGAHTLVTRFRAAWGKAEGAESIVGDVQEDSAWPYGTSSLEKQTCKQRQHGSAR